MAVTPRREHAARPRRTRGAARTQDQPGPRTDDCARHRTSSSRAYASLLRDPRRSERELSRTTRTEINFRQRDDIHSIVGAGARSLRPRAGHDANVGAGACARRARIRAGRAWRTGSAAAERRLVRELGAHAPRWFFSDTASPRHAFDTRSLRVRKRRLTLARMLFQN